MKTIIQQVEIKRVDHGGSKIIPLPEKKIKPNSKKQAEEFRLAELKKQEKLKEIDMRNTGKYFKEALKYATVDHPKELREKA